MAIEQKVNPLFEKVYDLKLGETVINLEDDGILIIGRLTRVPGGWIYIDSYTYNSPTSVFIPYSDEFIIKNK